MKGCLVAIGSTAIVVIAAVIAAMNEVDFLYETTGEGRPVCSATGFQPSQEAIVRQGVWSHLQALPAIRAVIEERAIQGPDGNLTHGNFEEPINNEAVDAFLNRYPDCCRVKKMGEGFGSFDRTIHLLNGREYAIVAIDDPSLISKTGHPVIGHRYEVHACSNNVRE